MCLELSSSSSGTLVTPAALFGILRGLRGYPQPFLERFCFSSFGFFLQPTFRIPHELLPVIGRRWQLMFRLFEETLIFWTSYLNVDR
jgi:hypothetical protein